MTEGPSRTHAILKKYARDIHAGWMSELADGLQLDRRITEAELSAQTREFLALLQTAVASDGTANLESAPWDPVREFLESISRSRAVVPLYGMAEIWAPSMKDVMALHAIS